MAKKADLRARLLETLDLDERALVENSPQIGYLRRIRRVVEGEEVEPLPRRERRRCDAIPSGFRCRLDRGHKMPHDISDGPWPEEAWRK